MNNSNTPHFSELLDWLEGRLPPDQARQVAERLETVDAATQADLDWLGRFLQAHQSIQFVSPPSGVRETLRQHFTAYTEARQPPSLFRRWLATLTFDSRMQPATAGLRSGPRADDSPQQQLIYTTEAAEIALTVHSTPPNKNFMVNGQIFPVGDIPAHAFSIQLLSGIREMDLALPDELGEFSFTNLPAGDYEIVVSTGEYEVVIPSLRLQ